MTTHPTDLDTLIKEERAKNERLERELAKCRAERLRLDRRIHNQRCSLRRNWEIVEARARGRVPGGYGPGWEGVRSRWFEVWDRKSQKLRAAEASALTARRDALEEAATWHDGKAKHHTFLANVRLRGETTDDQLRELARAELHAQSAYHFRTLASTVPGGRGDGISMGCRCDEQDHGWRHSQS